MSSFRSSLKSHWLRDDVFIPGIHQSIFILLSVSTRDLLNKFFQDKSAVVTVSPMQCRCQLVADMLLFLSVNMSLEFLGANSFLSFLGPFPPLQRHPQIFFSLPKDLTEIIAVAGNLVVSDSISGKHSHWEKCLSDLYGTCFPRRAAQHWHMPQA